jgi:hypothetical protein
MNTAKGIPKVARRFSILTAFGEPEFGFTKFVMPWTKYQIRTQLSGLNRFLTKPALMETIFLQSDSYKTEIPIIFPGTHLATYESQTC